ncbi:heat shock protein transcriptional repressor HspR [Actinomyces sp.]|uniref:heat shock protein transcriptional repressor HspR n=1 Tax=Actinomyces sp. TaxID=29317 RepID=UPI0026DBA239|nr:MerR family transcriptional regulator [Actinomyces sp.]MDO4901881.1 MerR family transcriptional regulator [Actinomyces sp.]
MTTRRLTGQGVDFLAEDADERAVYVISVAAELAGMHPQTLRQYDRLGLVTPARTSGRGRRYSHSDVERLRRVQALSQEGINLEGIRRILELERRLERLEEENRSLRARQAAVERVFAAAADGEVQVVPVAPGRRARGRAHLQGEGVAGRTDGGSSARPGTAIVVRRSW